MTTLHAYTGTQSLVDGPRGKLKGHAQHVPTKTGSVTELVSVLAKKTTAEEVNQAMKNAATNNESFGYTEEEIISSDVIGRQVGISVQFTTPRSLR